MIIQGSPDILRGPQGLNGFGDFGAPDDAVKQLFLTVLGRDADPAALKYFTDRFGTSIEPGEALTFLQMTQDEINARNAYLETQYKGTAQQAADARAIAAEFVRKQEQGKNYFFQADVQAEQARIAAEIAAAKAIEAANKKTIADALAAALAATKAVEDAKTLAAKQAAEALRAPALAAVRALYLQVLGREGDEPGVNYFADKFGDVIDPAEYLVFTNVSKNEIDARNKYLAEMSLKSKEDAAKAKALADQFAAVAAAARAKAGMSTGGGGDGGINPMLILAAAAAAFFIGG